MPDYLKSLIYTLRSRSREDLVYIGATTQTLANRMGGHRRNFMYWKEKRAGFETAYEILEMGDEYIELLEEYPCENVDQLRRRQGELIRSMECVNKRDPGRCKTCEHGRQRSRCKPCGGSEICEHDRLRSRCKPCEGFGRCEEHGRIKSECRPCGGARAQRMICDCGSSIFRYNFSQHRHTKKHKVWKEIHDFIMS